MLDPVTWSSCSSLSALEADSPSDFLDECSLGHFLFLRSACTLHFPLEADGWRQGSHRLLREGVDDVEPDGVIARNLVDLR